MGRVAEISLGDIRRAALRYRPVAVTVAAVVVAVALLPGAPGSAPDEEVATGPSPATSAPSAGEVASGGSPPDAAAGTDLTVTPPAGPAFVGSAAGTPSYAPPPAATGTGATSDPDLVYGEDTTPTTQEPFAIVARAWASREAGTPLADAGVPEGTLPVGSRLGTTDKATFLRLAGGGPSLSLAEDPAGRRDPVDGEIGVRACPLVDDDWEEAEARSFDESPTWREDGCVDGVADDDGTWLFDLTGLVEEATGNGLALVPAADVVDFQVAFQPNPVP